MIRVVSLFAVAVVVALAVAEIGARLLLPPARYHREAIELHPTLGFRGVPGHESTGSDGVSESFPIRFNSDGFRGPELPAPGADGAAARRIVFVGDSFLVGTGVPEAALATSLTRAALRGRGEQVEVYNLSGIDMGTAQQLLLLREYGARIQPTEIVLFLYTGNDLINNEIALAGRSRVSAGDYVRPYLVDEQGELVRRYTHPLRAALRLHSRLFAEIERLLLSAGSRGGFGLAPWPPPVDPVRRVRSGRAPFEDFEVFRRHDPGDAWERAWRTTERLLLAFQAECDALGARLLVVLVPNAHQVARNAKGMRIEVAYRVASGGSLDSALDWELPDRRLLDFAAQSGIDMTTLLPALRASVARGELPYGRDDHFSSEGHAIASQAVLDWLDGRPLAGFESQRRTRPEVLVGESSARVSSLSFAEDPHVRFLGDGFAHWSPRDGGDSGWGWTVGARAMLVVPIGEGELVVRGAVPDGLPLPIVGYALIMGLPAETFTLDTPGPFELRFARKVEGLELEPARGGHAVVELGFGAAVEDDDGIVGALLHEVGFAPAAADVP